MRAHAVFGALQSSVLVILVGLVIATAAPTQLEETTTTSDYLEDTNSTEELYVIREVVYEVGILTEEDNNTDTSDEYHEAVELRLFEPGAGGLDLGNLPAPLQTNVSVVSVTANVSTADPHVSGGLLQALPPLMDIAAAAAAPN